MVISVLNLDKSKKYLLACSYGPDSMALFDMLLKEEYKFEVAHVNYHKRDISNFEEESLKEYCLKNGIKIHLLDTSKLKKHQGNFQAWARNIRYEFFAKCLKENNLYAILTAHHLDDLLETYLMQEARHAIVDYYGIKTQTKMRDCLLIRPLLDYTKRELHEYCGQNHIPFSIDVSNLGDDYTRNKIRHDKIEHMTKEEKLNLKAKIDFKNYELLNLKNKLRKYIDNENRICVKNLNMIDPYSWAILLNLFLEHNKVSCNVSLKHAEEILKAIESDKPNIVIPLGQNKNLIKDYNFVKIANNLKVDDYIYIMEEPTKLDNEYFTLDLTSNYQTLRIKMDDFPITIRNYRPGDMSFINNIPKKVSRLFIDWKMPQELRSRWPLIFNKNNELIYIIRYYGDQSLVSHENFIVKK